MSWSVTLHLYLQSRVVRNAVSMLIWTTKRDDIDFKFLRKVCPVALHPCRPGPGSAFPLVCCLFDFCLVLRLFLLVFPIGANGEPLLQIAFFHYEGNYVTHSATNCWSIPVFPSGELSALDRRLTALRSVFNAKSASCSLLKIASQEHQFGTTLPDLTVWCVVFFAKHIICGKVSLPN